MATHSGRRQSLLGAHSGTHRAGVREGSWAAVPAPPSPPCPGPDRGAALPSPPLPGGPSSGSTAGAGRLNGGRAPLFLSLLGL